MKNIAVTGATGFVGRHLLESLSRQQGINVLALAFSTPKSKLPDPDRVTWIHGDLGDPDVARRLCARGSTLIHLAYPTDWSLQAHLESINRLAETAAEQGVGRVIHCSTAVVVGASPEQRITETTPLVPRSAYEKTKLRLEIEWAKQSHGKFDLAIARPTAVFGPGSKNLLSLANALTRGNPLINYLRLSLFGKRRMNLVCVKNVVSAIEFLAARETSCDGKAFLISDDDDPLNNFRDVERILRSELGVDHMRPPALPVPAGVLNLLLRASGKSNVNPHRIYDGSALRDAGWRKASSLEEGLHEFAGWFKTTSGAS